MIISAYTDDDKIVEGTVDVSPTGEKTVLYENKVINIKDLKHIRFLEDEETEIDKQVKSDIDVIKKDLESKKPSEDDIEKAGEARAKELSDAGMKEKEPDEYKTKFVLQASAVVSGAEAGVDATKADANNSDALKGLKESDDIHPDYQVTEPHQDDLTRDQIYQKMKQEIDNYQKNIEGQFDDKKLMEWLCDKLVGYNCINECKNRKEAFIEIRKNCKFC